MNDIKPVGTKWMERKYALPLAATALVVSYPLLLFMDDEYFILGFFLLGMPSALGIVTAWTSIKRWKIDNSLILMKYNLHPRTLAFGTGGPLAGLVYLGGLCREDYCLGRCNCESILFWPFLMVLVGQTLWLIWPLALLKAIGRNRPRLVERCGWLQDIIIILSTAALFPGMLIPVVPAVWLLSDIFC